MPSRSVETRLDELEARLTSRAPAIPTRPETAETFRSLIRQAVRETVNECLQTARARRPGSDWHPAAHEVPYHEGFEAGVDSVIDSLTDLAAGRAVEREMGPDDLRKRMEVVISYMKRREEFASSMHATHSPDDDGRSRAYWKGSSEEATLAARGVREIVAGRPAPNEAAVVDRGGTVRFGGQDAPDRP